MLSIPSPEGIVQEAPSPTPARKANPVFPAMSAAHWTALIVLCALALGIRFYCLTQPPLYFHPARQFRSALIARALYYDMQPFTPSWKKDIAQRNREGILEPPIMEYLAAIGYRVMGSEHLWFPSALSACFWVFGGLFLFLLITRYFSAGVGLFSTAAYLFLPFSITASRVFQPDPLMVMLLLASLYLISRYDQEPTWRRLAWAAALAALAIFAKVGTFFFIYGAFIALVGLRARRRDRPWWHFLAEAHAWTFVGISLLPVVLFYLNGIFVSGFLRGTAQSSFLPKLLLTIEFWGGWLTNINLTIGTSTLIAALLGLLVCREARVKVLLAGLWIGYVLYGLAFNYAMQTHNYYQMPLIPVVALSVAPLLALCLPQLRAPAARWHVAAAWVLAGGCIVGGIGLALPDILHPEFNYRAQIFREIGERVGHSTDTVFLSEEYGKALCYYAEIAGTNWPSSFDNWYRQLHGETVPTAAERLNGILAGGHARYFIVTDAREYQTQQDLYQLLTTHYPVLAFDENRGYVIFNLQR